MSDNNGATNTANTADQNMTYDEAVNLIFNTISEVATTRANLLQQLFDPRRDIPKECGYPESGSEYTADQYKQLYDHEPIAARCVEVLPMESWRSMPTVYESEDEEVETPFEAAVKTLPENLRGEKSYHKQEEGNIIWSTLRRADIMSGIGQYGVIVLGLDDGQELRTPARFRPGKNVTRKLTRLVVLPESLAPVSVWDTNPNSPRYGHPVEYNITFYDPRETLQSGIGTQNTTVQVHWTRIVHIVSDDTISDVYSVPQLRSVLRRNLDLQKLYGASAEGYWRSCFTAISLETHPQLGGDVNVDKPSIRRMMEDYANGLQRYLSLQGMSAKSLAPQVVDPASQIDAQITAICIKKGVPKRIFMGSERGELSSAQDSDEFADRMRDRRRMHITPRVLVPFFDRLINLGVLPEPTDGYCADWNDQKAENETEKANIGKAKTEALAKYTAGGCDTVITPVDYLTWFLGFDREEAETIIEAAEERTAEIEEEDEQNQLDLATMLPPQPNPNDPNNGAGGDTGKYPFSQGNGKGNAGDMSKQLPAFPPDKATK